jgi:proton-dependent oligopeptide transporter, POT family
VFATVPMFWALFNQVNSTWVLQGKKMTPFYLLDGETMQSAGAILVMIWVPILTLGVYPWLERRRILPTPLRRMSAGMVLGAVSFVGCGFIQSRMDHGATLSVAWQLVPYIVLEAGEVMLSATALEFAFSQAPERMKSIIMSFWLMTIAGGHFLVAAFTNLNSRFVHAHGAAEFLFYAALMFVVAGIFIFLATRYRGRTSGVSTVG